MLPTGKGEYCHCHVRLPECNTDQLPQTLNVRSIFWHLGGIGSTCKGALSVWVPPQLFVSPKFCGTQLLRTARTFRCFILGHGRCGEVPLSSVGQQKSSHSLNGTIYTQSEKHVLNDFDHGKRIRFTASQRTSYALDLLKKNTSLNKLDASSKTSSDQWICLVCFCFWYKFVLGRSCWVLLGKIWSMYLK